MTNKQSSNQTYKLIASHALVIAIFTAPYLMYLVADMYKITSHDASVVVVNQSLTTVMSFISTVALLVSIVAFGIYMYNRGKK